LPAEPINQMAPLLVRGGGFNGLDNAIHGERAFEIEF
jgi:hypothetical protein